MSNRFETKNDKCGNKALGDVLEHPALVFYKMRSLESLDMYVTVLNELSEYVVAYINLPGPQKDP
jgi:hypothetical protein